MLHLALAVSSLLSSQAGAPARDAEVYVPAGDVYCAMLPTTFDPTTVYTTMEAAPGGVFWLPLVPADGVAARIFSSISGAALRTGSGEELAVDVVRQTSSVVAIAVPNGALAGATFLLHPADSPDDELALVLRVVEPAMETGTVESVLEGTPFADPSCYADCVSEGQTAARAPAVAIVVEGGGVIVDAWQTFADGVPSSTDARLVDTRLVMPVVTVDGPSAETLQVGFDYVAGDFSTTIHVEARSPHDGALLEAFTLDVPSLATVPFEDETQWTCDEYEDIYYDDYYDGGAVCACAEVPSSSRAGALALVGVLVVAGRRRRV